jgi:thymidylate synthase (FAD)
MQSQRYVSAENAEFICPESIKENNDSFSAVEVFQDAIALAETSYDLLLSKGISPEDARFVLPNATATKLVMTMNARALRHLFAQRLCKQAQWEIRELAEAIHAICIDKAPILFEGSGPDCKNCEEKNSCQNKTTQS